MKKIFLILEAMNYGCSYNKETEILNYDGLEFKVSNEMYNYCWEFIQNFPT